VHAQHDIAMFGADGPVTLNFNNEMSKATVFLDIEKAFDINMAPLLDM
jgi:hypothetical protein